MDDIPGDPVRNTSDLWLLAAAGDEAAWRAVKDKYFRLLCATAARTRRAGESEPEDIAQEVLIKAWKYRDSIRSEAHLKPWMIKTVITTLIDHRRGRYHRHRHLFDALDGASQQASTALTPEELRIVAERERLVREGIAKLPPKLSRVVEAYINDTVGDEMPRGTQASRFRRARERLARWLNAHGISGTLAVGPYNRNSEGGQS